MRFTILLKTLLGVFLSLMLSVSPLKAQYDTEEIIDNGIRDFKARKYYSSLYYFEKALANDKGNDLALFYSGIVYMHLFQVEKALDIMRKINSESLEGDMDYHFWMAEAYFRNELFLQARHHLALYLKNDTRELYEEAKSLEVQLNNAIRFYKNPETYAVHNLGENINSKYEDFAPVLTPGQTVMFFTGNRQTFEDDIVDRYDDDKLMVYGSQVNPDGEWSKAEPIRDSVSEAETKNTALQVMAYDRFSGNLKLLLTRNGTLFFQERVRGKWLSPETPGKEFDYPRADEIYAYRTLDDSVMVFASDFKTPGNLNLYMAVRNGKNMGAPKALSTLNTPEQEGSPFLIGNRLYFSSQGHNSMGGFDIFYSDYEPETGSWSEPQNMGCPVNSVADDRYFSTNGKMAYLCSNRKESLGGEDIFRVFFFDKIKINGIVREQPESTPMQNTELVFRSETDTLSTRTDAEGRYELELPVLEKFSVTGYYEGNTLYEQYFEIEPEFLIGRKNKEIMLNFYFSMKIDKDIVLFDSDKEGKNYILKSVKFESGSAKIKPESFEELDRFVSFLKAASKVRVEIGGHTDNVGDDAANMALSQKRADAVKKYFTEKGLPETRFETKGYGEMRPIVSNDDEEEGREINRRIEAVIVK